MDARHYAQRAKWSALQPCSACGYLRREYGAQHGCQLCARSCRICGEEQLATDALVHGWCMQCIEAFQVRERARRTRYNRIATQRRRLQRDAWRAFRSE